MPHSRGSATAGQAAACAQITARAQITAQHGNAQHGGAQDGSAWSVRRRTFLVPATLVPKLVTVSTGVWMVAPPLGVPMTWYESIAAREGSGGRSRPVSRDGAAARGTTQQTRQQQVSG